ncbi:MULTISPECIES: demethylmenaquinone methyltransferase [unclassified Curtobacterium]|uniref:demethylmenaquinone methyltransferase n=1 Tax=unclassified Curtobacterium TaxID=257496 RepID=UPI000DA9E7B1|nr:MULTISPECIES: demethylmenaquinone methyltransferase [unclassified Curtobacterium]PZE26532.1 bifunctional demethylmenaquinone methyltransferase/2-methoxy-6-polyprenyl-1,4-benzoquinol methylase [Curtobacterium sp. MCBD17_028]PZE74277.1 bifunctional demethylmenaquinone methyltransferase/2-methoxy-6-polyprenyl-1,4-benzoquinol methylase [Curtobacterium sp. MCBD17_019]PZF58622.1 bifunctional demethylmenaquinone methyltransferase/2-methoxy-6-polyprenyl-1,4-benzoquinol methylase [Curtobacterium sp. M
MSRADMEKRPDEVAAMFDDVAARYDLTNDILSAGNAALWRVATTRAVDPRPGERVLDLAAGTGTSSVAFAKRGAEVTALDLSAGMIEVGRQRHPEITFVHGDAEQLPFEDDSFDAVSISFGLRNVNEPSVALAEMYRVLKPGGRVVICEFSTPPLAVLRLSYTAYLKRVLPGIARLSSSNPAAYRYLAESISAWPDQQVLSQWLRGVGFTMVAYRNLTAGIVALHRGRKPVAGAVRESAARRAKARRAHQPTGEQPRVGTEPDAPAAERPGA